jgi:glycosyltransferase involved in cell wall biosynthesis
MALVTEPIADTPATNTPRSVRRPVVCQLLHGLWVGGAEVLAARLARRNRDRCRYVFACLDDLGTLGRQLREEGFPVEVLERRPGLDWRCTLRLARFLRRHRVDLVHAHQYTPFFYGMTARLLYRRPGVLFMEHGRHQPDYPRPKRILANRVLLTGRDRVVGVGEAVRQALIHNEGLAPDRVSVIYNGIDVPAFAGASAQREAVRRELGIEEEAFVIIQVARLDYLKDHATAVRTLAGVVAQHPNALLVLVGEGPELAKIQAVIAELRLESRVRLLGLRHDIPRLLGAADVFLLTSISEGIPVTIIEAMAAGLPVVSTDVGGVAEVVEEGLTGFLAPAGDHAALAERLLRLAAYPELRRRLGTAGRERARDHFSESSMHAAFLRLYQEMLATR